MAKNRMARIFLVLFGMKKIVPYSLTTKTNYTMMKNDEDHHFEKRIYSA